MEQSGNTVRCQNCGHENQPGDTYCANCGARLRKDLSIPPQYPSPPPAAPQPSPPPFNPQPIQPLQTAPQEAPDSEWRMSSLGPPPKPKRRVWLWVLIGLIIACVVICVGFGVFLNTSTGSHWFSNLATEAAQKATQQSK